MSKIREALAKAKLERKSLEEAPNRTRLGRLATRETSATRESSNSSAGVEVNPNKQVHVDRVALRHAGLLAPENHERQLADEYRQIKRPLLANAQGRTGVEVPRGNLIMISGAVSGEGKTFTCINLSLSIAREKDWRVVLVDGDIAKPHLTNLFGLADEPGLLDLLRDPDLSIGECIIATDLPGVAILPAGRRDDSATELLASKRMELLTSDLVSADPGTIVLFDSPPMLMTTESAVLASHMGQVVVVVRAGHTTHQQLEHTLTKLDPEKAISLILNQAELGADSLAHGGSYGYYGYGQSSEGRDAPAEAPL